MVTRWERLKERLTHKLAADNKNIFYTKISSKQHFIGNKDVLYILVLQQRFAKVTITAIRTKPFKCIDLKIWQVLIFT